MNTLLSKNIKWLRESKGFTQEAFCKKLGFKKADLSKWENANNKPRIEKLSKIAEFHSTTVEDLLNKDFSKILPHFEKGKDNNEEIRTNNKFIPLHSIGLHDKKKKELSEDNALREYAEMIDAGDLFRDAAEATLIYDDSMYPKYPAGSIILYKEVFDKEFFVFGKDYLIETAEYQLLKRVQKSNRDGYIMLCSYNEKTDVNGNLIYESMELPINKIKRIFKIIGKAERNESSYLDKRSIKLK